MPSSAVDSIPGIGPKAVEQLKRLGIRTVTDLLLHLPRKYEDRSKRTKIADVKEEPCVVQGRITRVFEHQGARRSLQVDFTDDSGKASMRLMYFGLQLKSRLNSASWLYVYGKPSGEATFFHPEFRIYDVEPEEPKSEFRPVYGATYNLTSKKIALWIRRSISEVAFFPHYTFDEQTLAEAVRLVHTPNPLTHPKSTQSAMRRIMFDEMLAFMIVQRRRSKQPRPPSTPLLARTDLATRLLGNLGFELTGAQKRVVAEVLGDLEQPTAMRRLVQGDVGSGKTIVAALAAIRAAENQAQTAVMAPTELLAEQHYQVFSEWLTPLGIEVALLTSRMPTRQRRTSQSAVANGEISVVIGTHALFQDKTQFKQLGLTIIDEQHRFGVHQRMQLVNKGESTHQLVLTATPIPRTLALSMFGDLAISTIDELPPGRTPITTSLHPNTRRDHVVEAVERRLRNGHQVYWVCVAIDDNEENELVASTSTYEQLAERLNDIGIGHITGRMKVGEKNKIMSAFRDGELRLLVATTVIEVGIDVPNATVMVIENAERLGLAQLHQLRGRVGRGSEASYCLLLYQTPISSNSEHRLQTMRRSNDGFELAETDLKIRGMGQMFGAKQSGLDPFRIADLGAFINRRDELIEQADALLDQDVELADQVIATWTPEGQGYVAS